MIEQNPHNCWHHKTPDCPNNDHPIMQQLFSQNTDLNEDEEIKYDISQDDVLNDALELCADCKEFKKKS